MGIIADALVIILGCLLGARISKKTSSGDLRILGIGIMMMSLVGFVENVFRVEEHGISGANLTVVLFAYLIGTKTGELLHLEEKLSSFGKKGSAKYTAVADAFIFFGVGGMQICGPVGLALLGDNTLLLIKCAFDLPFALVFGSTYGSFAALSAIPVAAVQVLIAVSAYFFVSLFTDALISQICAMGYLILFFSGFNLMTDGRFKISNINMMPGILFALLFGIVKELFL